MHRWFRPRLSWDVEGCWRKWDFEHVKLCEILRSVNISVNLCELLDLAGSKGRNLGLGTDRAKKEGIGFWTFDNMNDNIWQEWYVSYVSYVSILHGILHSECFLNVFFVLRIWAMSPSSNLGRAGMTRSCPRSQFDSLTWFDQILVLWCEAWSACKNSLSRIVWASELLGPA